MLALRPHRDRYGYHALASGGIGWGLPASVGVSMANPDRPVVCFSGDGSAMYSIQALWTAAHHKLPLTVVIANNGGYRIIKQRLLAFHGDNHYVGMDFADPPVDFAGIAKSLGLEAMRITEAKDLKPALTSAFKRPGAKLIEVVVDGTVLNRHRCVDSGAIAKRSTPLAISKMSTGLRPHRAAPMRTPHLSDDGIAWNERAVRATPPPSPSRPADTARPDAARRAARGPAPNSFSRSVPGR